MNFSISCPPSNGSIPPALLKYEYAKIDTLGIFFGPRYQIIQNYQIMFFEPHCGTTLPVPRFLRQLISLERTCSNSLRIPNNSVWRRQYRAEHRGKPSLSLPHTTEDTIANSEPPYKLCRQLGRCTHSRTDSQWVCSESPYTFCYWRHATSVPQTRLMLPYPTFHYPASQCSTENMHWVLWLREFQIPFIYTLQFSFSVISSNHHMPNEEIIHRCFLRGLQLWAPSKKPNISLMD